MVAEFSFFLEFDSHLLNSVCLLETCPFPEFCTLLWGCQGDSSSFEFQSHYSNCLICIAVLDTQSFTLVI